MSLIENGEMVINKQSLTMIKDEEEKAKLSTVGKLEKSQAEPLSQVLKSPPPGPPTS